jgi:hypothetical protein
LVPHYNIAPTQPLAVVRTPHQLEFVRWDSNNSHVQPKRRGEVVRAHPDGASGVLGKTQTWFRHVAEHAFDIRQYTVLGYDEPTALARASDARVRALNLALD